MTNPCQITPNRYNVLMIKGTQHSEETKKLISEKKKLNAYVPKSAFKKGCVPWNKGKKCPYTSERNRIQNKARIREKHWNWKGGVSKIDKIIRRMKEYIDWRESVFKRDNFTCVECGYKGYVTAHHIKSFSSIIKENKIENTEQARTVEILWDINNGKTLCEPCHSKTDNYAYKAK